MTKDDIYSIMITVYRRNINGKKGDWEFDSMYVDGCEGGKHREKAVYYTHMPMPTTTYV